MKYSKWIGLLAVGLMIGSCFLPWIYVPSKGIIVTGLDATGTNFGKPGLVNIALAGMSALLFLLPYLLAKRFNIFFIALNLAWALRNYIILSMCRSGECPEKKTGLYLLMTAALIMLVAALFPDVKLKEEDNPPV